MIVTNNGYVPMDIGTLYREISTQMEKDLFSHLSHLQIVLLVILAYIVIKAWNALIDSEIGIHTPFEWIASKLSASWNWFPICRRLKEKKLIRMREEAERRYLSSTHRDKRRTGMPEKGMDQSDIQY